MKKIEEKSIKDTPKPKTRHNTDLCSCYAQVSHIYKKKHKKLQIKYRDKQSFLFFV